VFLIWAGRLLLIRIVLGKFRNFVYEELSVGPRAALGACKMLQVSKKQQMGRFIKLVFVCSNLFLSHFCHKIKTLSLYIDPDPKHWGKCGLSGGRFCQRGKARVPKS
jgi:hypothetical protein